MKKAPTKMRRLRPRAALASSEFTLIELLVVVSIISILAAMLLPALSKARNKVRTTVCITTMRNLAQITDLYVEDTEGFLPRSVHGVYSAAEIAVWDDVAARLAAKFPQFQVPQRSNGATGGYEARLMLGDYLPPDEVSDYLRCPSDPRMDWLPGQSTHPAAEVIDPTGTPTVTYEAAACWAGRSTGNGNYIKLDRGYVLGHAFRRSVLEGADADKELYYIHGGGSKSSLLFQRDFWGWGSWGSTYGLPTEYHPSRVPPGTELNSTDPTKLIRTDGLTDFSARIAYNDFAGWKNPYVFLDEHVEIADSIWANPSWHQYHSMLEGGVGWSPLPGDVSRTTYTPGARTRAANAH